MFCLSSRSPQQPRPWMERMWAHQSPITRQHLLVLPTDRGMSVTRTPELTEWPMAKRTIKPPSSYILGNTLPKSNREKNVCSKYQQEA